MQMRNEQPADERAVILAEHKMELQNLASVMSASDIHHKMLLCLLSNKAEYY